MKRELINSQLSNFKTYDMYRRQFLTLAENVFEFKNLPEFIDLAYLNKQLLRKGAIAFFKDEVLGVLALPYINVSNLDIYGRPRRIQVIAQNGYTRFLDSNEFVIMYDNEGRYPLWLDIIQYAERMANIVRTIDINVSQQRTPRVWKTKQENEKSLRDLINNVDGNENKIITYKDIDLDDTQIILSPAPYVTDKLDLEKDKLYNEFLRLIGIANLSYEKKERNIRDEIQAMQGGTVASRFSRYEPREKAVKQINEKFGTNIEVRYYDGLPSMLKEDNKESEVDINVENDSTIY
jgi:hypothetical protein